MATTSAAERREQARRDYDAFLDGCPVVDVPGRIHPMTIAYAPDQPMAAAAVEDFLVSLPKRTFDAAG